MRDTKYGLVLMTALPPTLGHANLLEFAGNFLEMMTDGNWMLDVVVSSRSTEPFSGKSRVAALETRRFECEPYRDRIYFSLHEDDSAPQNPSESESEDEFWDYWRGVVSEHAGTPDYVFSSESYGPELARRLGAKHVPYDPRRNALDVRATDIRRDYFKNIEHVLPEFQRDLRPVYTMFGQESVGKTTLTRALADRLTEDGYRVGLVEEWARTYLETPGVGHEVTLDKMNTILAAQTAAEVVARYTPGVSLVLQDTDTLSTLGYWRHWRLDSAPDGNWIEHLRSRRYFVLSDEIPFVKDPLRYGGDKRETATQFWIDLLEEFGCSYTVITGSDLTSRVDQVYRAIRDDLDDMTRTIASFERT